MNSFYSHLAGATVRWFDFQGQGDPIVFIHGLGCASSYDYPPVVSNPVLNGRRALLIDLPGYGYSDKPLQFGYRIADQAAVVVEWLNKLQVSRCILYGHSMGGSVAIEAAQRLGKRVEALIVAEPNLYAGGGFYSCKIAGQTEDDFIANGYQSMLAEETSPWKGCLQNSAPWALWRGATSLVVGASPSWFERFIHLQCRKTLIYGSLSLPSQEAEDVETAGIALAVIPQAGHSMAWENPTALARVIAGLL